MRMSCLTVDCITITDVYIQGSQSCLPLCSREKNKLFLGVFHLDHFRCVLEWGLIVLCKSLFLFIDYLGPGKPVQTWMSTL